MLSLGLKYVIIEVHLSPSCINILILLLLTETMHPLFSCSFLLALEDLHIPIIRAANEIGLCHSLTTVALKGLGFFC